MTWYATSRPLVLAVGLLLTTGASAQPVSDAVLAEYGNVKLYRSEYDAELLKLTPDIRPGFANSQKRIDELIQRLIVQKALAAQALERKLEQDPVNATRLSLERDRTLAQLRVAEVEEAAGREFDARAPQNEARARELYLADRKRYEMPEQVQASHILFDKRKHSREEGLKLAQETRARIMAGANFNDVAQKVSEDPSVAQNGGRLGWFAKPEMDPAFADAAFGLRKEGDVSEPILSSFGWHLIRLEGHRPAGMRSFDMVKDLVLADMRKKYVDDRRDVVIRGITEDAKLKINEAAVSTLYVSPETEKAKRAIEAAKQTGTPAGPAPK